MYAFARRHNLTIEDRREYDEFGREEFECDRFEPSYLNVKFMDRQGMKVKVSFAYVDWLQSVLDKDTPYVGEG